MSLKKMREWRDFRDPALSSSARQVLHALLTYADPEGYGARPSVARLAADCGRQVRWVQNALASLRAFGALEIQRQATRYTPTVYRVLSPPAGVHGHAPLKCEPIAVMGARPDVSGVHAYAPDQVLRSGNMHSAAPRPARAQRKVLETPTRDQVTKLVHVLLDDRELRFSERGDLQELVKRACAKADFLYNTVVVEDGIGRALAARGVDPAAADVTAARRRG